MRDMSYLLGAVSLLVVVNVAAQSNPHNGTWVAAYKTERGTDRDGTVVVENDGGSWDMNVQSRNDPCVGRKVPITVQKATADELIFEVSRSKALTGCPDTQMTLKAVDASTLTGTFGGREFTMKKK